MAGPTTTATDGTEAALIVVHDGGPDGEGDTALMWLTRGGQTLHDRHELVREQFTPEGPPLPLTEGDVEIQKAVEVHAQATLERGAPDSSRGRSSRVACRIPARAAASSEGAG